MATDVDDNTEAQLTIDDILGSINVAELLDEETLTSIGNQVAEDFKTDQDSRNDWMEDYDRHLDLALQVSGDKTTPWEGAANVKYPLMQTAAMQFGARSYPALINGTKIVKGKVCGYDPDGSKQASAIRVGQHMSYQLLEEMDDWEEDMDRLCTTLPIIGCMFKKTYFSPIHGKNVSDLVYPKDLVVNYYTKNLRTARRITHIIEMDKNDIYERIAAELYIDQEYGKPVGQDKEDAKDSRIGIEAPSSIDSTTPYIMLEQHKYLDLDGDGYAEPYIVTVEEKSQKVARIVARFDPQGVKRKESGKLLRIEPVEYFTKFGFVPNPDGGFYDIGFGKLLSSINEVINTTINQLLDSGTLSTLQAGFISRGIRIKGGNKTFKPGEWKTVNATGDDLRKGIVPLPTREPSQVLFTLLNLMIEGGQKLSSVTDMLMGENPGQNQPATTTMAVLEQGLKVFSSIYKRMHRSLHKEFQLLYRLNRLYLEEASYFEILDIGAEGNSQVFAYDYSEDTTNVRPYSDPNVASESQRLIKAQALMELLPTGTVNPTEVTKRILEAQEQSGIEQLMTMPPPQPNPEHEIEIEKLRQKGMLDMDESDRDWVRVQIEAESVEMKNLQAASRIYLEQNQPKEETSDNGGDKQS